MRMYDIIKKKRDGERLNREEIRFFIEGITDGSIPDYQASALCMAIFYKGMDEEETTDLTLAIRDSGEKLSFPSIKGVRVDKHSTGGVGDKTSLIVAPIVASLGVKVAKISGRGLGHTGGTVDKLESIQGFRTALSTEEFERIVNENGLAIAGQSADIAPADKKLYALRDVTATVDSMPLIASSIMGKKLAADDDAIVLDVKTGSGSFMKTLEASVKLAELMVGIGKRAGKKMSALITNMDIPLGYAIGNSLEVKEAVATLSGEGPKDLTEVCVALAAEMLFLAGKGEREICESLARRTIADRSALKVFAAMVAAQGGDPSWIEHPELFPTAKYEYTVRAPKDAYIASVDTEGYGIASLLLGAGRNTAEDSIDYAAGIILCAKVGSFVHAGDPIAVLYTEREELLLMAKEKLLASTVFSDDKPDVLPLILGRVE